MLTPNQLQALPDSLVALYEQLESEIIADMARRITRAEYLTDTAAWQSFKVQELKATRAQIIRKLSRITGKSERELKKMFEDAGAAALAYDDEIYKAAGLSPIPLAKSKALQAALAAGLKNTKGELRNLTRTTANTASKQFEDALDAAYMRIMSGAFSQQDAIRRAVKALAAEGLQSIRYPSGYTDHMDVAIRRAALTGVNQTAGVLQETRADEMGCDLVQTTSHMGARPEHAVWQGRIFSRSGKHRKYPNFVSATGYGTGPGLCGWNCAHSFYPFFEGLSADTYTRYDTEENRKAYEQSQQQRAYERAIRQSKRELAALDSAIKAAPDEATRTALEAEFQRSASILRRRKDRMEAFLRDTGRTRHTDREQVLGFGRSEAAKATWAARKLKERAKGGILKDINLEPLKVTADSLKRIQPFSCGCLDSAGQRALCEAHKRLLASLAGKPPGTEASAIFDLSMRKLGGTLGKDGAGKVRIPDAATPYIGAHTHPTGGTFTHTDVELFAKRKNMVMLTAVGNNGVVYALEKTSQFDPGGFWFHEASMLAKHSDFLSSPENYAVFVNELLKEAKAYGIRYYPGATEGA